MSLRAMESYRGNAGKIQNTVDQKAVFDSFSLPHERHGCVANRLVEDPKKSSKNG